MIFYLKVWKTLEQSYGKEELESKKEQAASKGQLRTEKSIFNLSPFLCLSSRPFRLRSTVPTDNLAGSSLRGFFNAGCQRFQVNWSRSLIPDLSTSVTCSVSGTGDPAPLDWMTSRSALIRQQNILVLITSGIRTSF